ncbi:hypothetical protein H4219_003545 [Mycoemilia scoparia]|uniref:Uncharacterized protein n=1 Tax=Mycoemilia scoparia TaxID=417184 RepID=A0A9W8DSH5_9FUNG|nr:hypothetical protein H4219_003545 [Mycoemilia scoparia]
MYQDYPYVSNDNSNYNPEPVLENYENNFNQNYNYQHQQSQEQPQQQNYQENQYNSYPNDTTSYYFNPVTTSQPQQQEYASYSQPNQLNINTPYDSGIGEQNLYQNTIPSHTYEQQQPYYQEQQQQYPISTDINNSRGSSPPKNEDDSYSGARKVNKPTDIAAFLSTPGYNYNPILGYTYTHPQLGVFAFDPPSQTWKKVPNTKSSPVLVEVNKEKSPSKPPRNYGSYLASYAPPYPMGAALYHSLYHPDDKKNNQANNIVPVNNPEDYGYAADGSVLYQQHMQNQSNGGLIGKLENLYSGANFKTLTKISIVAIILAVVTKKKLKGAKLIGSLAAAGLLSIDVLRTLGNKRLNKNKRDYHYGSDDSDYHYDGVDGYEGGIDRRDVLVARSGDDNSANPTSISRSDDTSTSKSERNNLSGDVSSLLVDLGKNFFADERSIKKFVSSYKSVLQKYSEKVGSKKKLVLILVLPIIALIAFLYQRRMKRPKPIYYKKIGHITTY